MQIYNLLALTVAVCVCNCIRKLTLYDIRKSTTNALAQDPFVSSADALIKDYAFLNDKHLCLRRSSECVYFHMYRVKVVFNSRRQLLVAQREI